jgi:hypothetical protein
MVKSAAAAIATAMAIGFVTPAFAQMGGLGDKETPLQKQERRKEEERKAIEKDYEKTMQRLKRQGGTTDSNASDPWAVVRPAAAQAKPEGKAEAKPETKKR